MPSDPKTIAVFLDESDAARERLAFACEVAIAFAAHVAAFFIDATPRAIRNEEVPLLFSRGVGIDDAVKRYFERGRESAVRLQRHLESWATEHRLTSTWCHVPLYASLRDVALRCTYADLLVLPAFGRDSSDQPWTSPALVLASGVPGVLVPDEAPHGLPRHVTIAWNATQFARRAVADAIPFLERAEHITIVVVDGHARASSTEGDPGDELARLLIRRGLSPLVETVSSGGQPTSEVLVRCARRLETDMIVAGAYGHSKIVEVALGSTTRALLGSGDLPFFISH